LTLALPVGHHIGCISCRAGPGSTAIKFA
jgi:hypothetical protein